LRDFKELVRTRVPGGPAPRARLEHLQTAEVIDTPRSNLYKKLEQYGITQESDG
jgi:DNA-binding NtrC family response regulator